MSEGICVLNSSYPITRVYTVADTVYSQLKGISKFLSFDYHFNCIAFVSVYVSVSEKTKAHPHICVC